VLLWEAATDRPLLRIRVLADLSVPAVLRDVVLPYLAGLGEHWQRGTASVAMVHFATNVIRGRLAGLGRGWGSRHRPQALEPRRPEHADLARASRSPWPARAPRRRSRTRQAPG
jgi:hypothetical protein